MSVMPLKGASSLAACGNMQQASGVYMETLWRPPDAYWAPWLRCGGSAPWLSVDGIAAGFALVAGVGGVLAIALMAGLSAILDLPLLLVPL